MRRILVDHARTHLAEKRGGGATRVPIDEPLSLTVESDADVLVIDEALQKLAALNPRHAEIVSMRFFGGMSVEEVAASIYSALGIDPAKQIVTPTGRPIHLANEKPIRELWG